MESAIFCTLHPFQTLHGWWDWHDLDIHRYTHTRLPDMHRTFADHFRPMYTSYIKSFTLEQLTDGNGTDSRFQYASPMIIDDEKTTMKNKSNKIATRRLQYSHIQYVYSVHRAYVASPFTVPAQSIVCIAYLCRARCFPLLYLCNCQFMYSVHLCNAQCSVIDEFFRKPLNSNTHTHWYRIDPTR